MPAKKKPAAPARKVAVADQILIGFDQELGLLKPEQAREKVQGTLASLQKEFGVTVLQSFVTGAKQPFFALGRVVLDDPSVTLESLQVALKERKKSFASIAYVERNAPIALDAFNDPLAGQQWALEKIGVTGRWTRTPPGGKTIVAIIDSGLRGLDGGVPADIGTVEAVEDSQPQPVDPDEPGGYPGLCLDGIDEDGHGTLLAGTIAAVPDNNAGLASPIPSNWGISLMPIKFFGPGAPPNVADAAIAIIYAVVKGAKVINASWHVGLGDHDRRTLRLAIKVAKDQQCLVVAAAGNDGSDNAVYPTYPANYGSEAEFKNLAVLTVAATDRHDEKAPFSNYGRDIVDLAAPGVGMLTTGKYFVDPPRYPAYNGTSASAALVSSAAALVYALNPAWKAKQVMKHLIASADPIPRLADVCMEGRRLNIGRAVAGPLRFVAPIANQGVPAGQDFDIEWENVYDQPDFRKVRIEFSKNDGATWTEIKASVNNDGLARWKPKNSDKTLSGRLRITPWIRDPAGSIQDILTAFDVVSERFRVV